MGLGALNATSWHKQFDGKFMCMWMQGISVTAAVHDLLFRG
jgi:hypothetical protein